MNPIQKINIFKFSDPKNILEMNSLQEQTDIPALLEAKKLTFHHHFMVWGMVCGVWLKHDIICAVFDCVIRPNSIKGFK